MRVTPVVVGAALLAAACNATPSNLEPAGPGTTAPIVFEAPAKNPLPEVPALRLELITDGLAEPVALANRRGDDLLYVAERLGRVMVVEDGTILPDPFLDLSDVVYGPISEQGLLGLTFDPDGDRLFLLYTDDSGAVQVVAYDVSANAVVADSATPILTVEQPHRFHQGGGIAFGPDGYLWIGLGDGGGIGDPNRNGQNPGTLLGSIVRIDVDAHAPYAVPPDNPFPASGDAAHELWGYGLRNPWRFTFDGGFVYIADVGQYEREEINVVPLAASAPNFGWAIQEGDRCYEAESCDTEGLVPPTFIIPHERSCAVVGGPVYRGEAIPELEGHYFYADYCVGWVRSLVFDGREVIAEHDWEADLGLPGHITTFGIDASGEMLVATQEGQLHRIVAAP
jgi:glucose/arabinose dehydrogenase